MLADSIPVREVFTSETEYSQRHKGDKKTIWLWLAVFLWPIILLLLLVLLCRLGIFCIFVDKEGKLTFVPGIPGEVYQSSQNANFIPGEGLAIVSTNKLSLEKTGVIPGVYGAEDRIPILKVDEYGRLLYVSEVSVKREEPEITPTPSPTPTPTPTMSAIHSINNQTGPDVTIAGVSHQTSVSAGGNVITIKLPQDIDTVSSPQFANVHVTQNLYLGDNFYGGTATILGHRSMALGDNNRLEDSYNFVIGGNNRIVRAVDHAEGSAIFGFNNTVEQFLSYAFGDNNTIHLSHSFVVGDDNEVGAYGYAFGSHNQLAETYSFTAGSTNQTIEHYSYALGRNNSIGKAFSLGVGSDNQLINEWDYVFGEWNVAQQLNTVIFGSHNSLVGSAGNISEYGANLILGYQVNVSQTTEPVIGTNLLIGKNITVTTDDAPFWNTVFIAKDLTLAKGGHDALVIGDSVTFDEDLSEVLIIGGGNSFKNLGDGMSDTTETILVVGDDNDVGGTEHLILGQDNILNSYSTFVLGYSNQVGSDTYHPEFNFLMGHGNFIDEGDGYNFLLGQYSTIKGSYSFALGSVYLGGNYSFAFGHGGSVQGDYSFVIGSNSGVIGDYSYSFGNTVGTVGDFSYGFGNGVGITGNYSYGFGKGSGVYGDYSYVFGDGVGVSGNYSYSFGEESGINGDYSYSFGSQTGVVGDYSFAFGERSTVYGNYSYAFGNEAGVDADYSFAFGEQVEVNSVYSFAFGQDISIDTYKEIILGYYPDNISGSIDTWDPDDPLFIIANGEDASNRSNALVLLKSGDLGVGTNSPGALLQVGEAGDGTEALANAWNTFSDIRFKRDIVPIDNALEKVLALNGVYYRWKNHKSNKRELGFIAQQVREILPEVVSEDSNGYLSIDYGKLTAVLVNAVKEQQAQINNLEKRVGRLEEDVLGLKDQKRSSQNNNGDENMETTMAFEDAFNFGNSLRILVSTVFEKDVLFLGRVVFQREAEFKQNVVFERAPVYASSNVAGYVVLPKGQREVQIKFKKPLMYKPVVVVSPDTPVMFAVKKVDKEGFTIQLSDNATKDIVFSWYAVQVRKTVLVKGPTQDPKSEEGIGENEQESQLTSNGTEDSTDAIDENTEKSSKDKNDAQSEGTSSNDRLTVETRE